MHSEPKQRDRDGAKGSDGSILQQEIFFPQKQIPYNRNNVDRETDRPNNRFVWPVEIRKERAREIMKERSEKVRTVALYTFCVRY